MVARTAAEERIDDQAQRIRDLENSLALLVGWAIDASATLMLEEDPFSLTEARRVLANTLPEPGPKEGPDASL